MSPAHVQRRASGQVAAGTHTLCNEPRTGIMRRPRRAGISFLRVSSPRLPKRRREAPPRPGSVRKKDPHKSLFYSFALIIRSIRWKMSEFGGKIARAAPESGGSTLENSNGRQ